ncbi:hypothetical protein ACOMHN_034972 [Nucella lapillus]
MNMSLSTTAYSTGLDSWAQVEVPKGRGMMMSFTQLSLSTCEATLDIYQAGRHSTHLRTRLRCPKRYIPPFIYNQTVHFHFRTGERNEFLGRGFRLVFTLHSLSKLLQRASKGTRLVKDRFGQDDFYDKDNLWNCSVSSWGEFIPHFPCNAKWNCVSGEDEVHCPYTDEDLCGPGQLGTKDSCHQLFLDPGIYFWNQSSLACMQKGGQLSGLNSAEKWGMVSRYLTLKHQQYAFFGISTFPVYTSPINEWQEVAYTLVCDYRDDCSDRNDE